MNCLLYAVNTSIGIDFYHVIRILIFSFLLVSFFRYYGDQISKFGSHPNILFLTTRDPGSILSLPKFPSFRQPSWDQGEALPYENRLSWTRISSASVPTFYDRRTGRLRLQETNRSIQRWNGRRTSPHPRCKTKRRHGSPVDDKDQVHHLLSR